MCIEGQFEVTNESLQACNVVKSIMPPNTCKVMLSFHSMWERMLKLNVEKNVEIECGKECWNWMWEECWK